MTDKQNNDNEDYNAARPAVIVGLLVLVAGVIYVVATGWWRVDSDSALRAIQVDNTSEKQYDDIIAAVTAKDEAGKKDEKTVETAEEVSGKKSEENLAPKLETSLELNQDNLDDNSNSKLSNKLVIDNNMTEGKTTTDSGLQYEVMVMGDGTKPTISDEVEVHYHGTLEDGTVFDSSVDRGERISFPLGNVITGWQEGLQLMPIGSKFKFTIPANLAYGDREMGQIPAGSTLIFEVELFGIK